VKRATLAIAACLAVALPAAASAHGARPPAGPDPVIQWNRRLLGLLRTPGQQPATVHPTRSMALLHVAILGAVAGVGHRRFSRAAAADAAGHRVLITLFAGQQQALDAQYAALLAQLPDGPRTRDGVRAGERRNEAPAGARRRRLGGDATALRPRHRAGRLSAHAAGLRARGLHALVAGDALRPGTGRPIPSAATAAAGKRRLRSRAQRGQGAGRRQQHGPQRRPDRAGEVLGSAYPELLERDRAVGGARAPRHAGAERVALRGARHDARRQRDRLLRRQVRLPPVAADHGNPRRGRRRKPGDGRRPAWAPLAKTPADPSYPGAHSVVSAAAAAVLDAFSGGDADRFAVTSEVLPGVTRHFDRFSAAVDEAGRSRIYAGVHTSPDDVAGRALGRAVARFDLRHIALGSGSERRR
jgi:hypothetical protein